MKKQAAERLASLQAGALAGGGEDRIQKQHEKGKLTARERIDLLLDDQSFEEIGMLVLHRNTDFDMDKVATLKKPLYFIKQSQDSIFDESIRDCVRRKDYNTAGLSYSTWRCSIY